MAAAPRSKSRAFAEFQYPYGHDAVINYRLRLYIGAGRAGASAGIYEGGSGSRPDLMSGEMISGRLHECVILCLIICCDIIKSIAAGGLRVIKPGAADKQTAGSLAGRKTKMRFARGAGGHGRSGGPPARGTCSLRRSATGGAGHDQIPPGLIRKRPAGH